jgi:hypothetical protein
MTDDDIVRYRRLGRARRPRSPEPVTGDIEQLIQLSRNAEAGSVQRFFNACLSRRVDEELEEMAVWVLSSWDPDVDSDKIKALMAGGQFRMASNAVIAQMRREIAKELRAHKRADSDSFLDACAVD